MCIYPIHKSTCPTCNQEKTIYTPKFFQPCSAEYQPTSTILTGPKINTTCPNYKEVVHGSWSAFCQPCGHDQLVNAVKCNEEEVQQMRRTLRDPPMAVPGDHWASLKEWVSWFHRNEPPKSAEEAAIAAAVWRDTRGNGANVGTGGDGDGDGDRNVVYWGYDNPCWLGNDFSDGGIIGSSNNNTDGPRRPSEKKVPTLGEQVAQFMDAEGKLR